MSTFDNAIQGIKHMRDPEVLTELHRIQESYNLSRNIDKGSKLTDTQHKELCTMWADYLLTVGGKYNGTVGD